MLSRAHVTFDGGQTWSEYPIFSNSAYQAHRRPGGRLRRRRPRLLRDARLPVRRPGQRAEPGRPRRRTRGDGGKTWTGRARRRRAAATGRASATCSTRSTSPPGATATRSSPSATSGSARRAPSSAREIYSSVTHDGGNTLVDAAADLRRPRRGVRLGADRGRRRPDLRRVPQHDRPHDRAATTTRSSRSARPRARASPGPFKVATVDRRRSPTTRSRSAGRPTRTASSAPGRPATSPPTRPTPTHLAVVWSDMRNSPTAGADRPVRGDDELRRGRQPVLRPRPRPGRPRSALALAGDQFMPWGAYDATGRLRIGTFDRSYDAANHLYGYSLATETAPGTLGVRHGQVTTALLRPDAGRPLVRRRR